MAPACPGRPRGGPIERQAALAPRCSLSRASELKPAPAGSGGLITGAAMLFLCSFGWKLKTRPFGFHHSITGCPADGSC